MGEAMRRRGYTWLVTRSEKKHDGEGTSGDAGRVVRIDCTNCHFSAVVSDEDEVTPADVLVDHGREHGHTLDICTVDD
jgi:hypothetical protein